MTPPMERIQILESIEKDIIICLQSAGEFDAWLMFNFIHNPIIFVSYHLDY